MTFERFLIIALLLVLVVILFRPQQQIKIEVPNAQAAPSAAQSVAGGDILSVIHNRKSVRNYTADPVSLEELHTLVRAGFAAPTGSNKQPWEFIIVTEREKLDAMAELLTWGKMLKQAPAAIIVSSNSETPDDDHAVKISMLDCAAACENILLAAEGTGLGAVWCAGYPYEDHIAGIQEIIAAPQDVIPVAVISIGQPTGVDQPKNKYKPGKMHFQSWNTPFPSGS